MDNDVVTEHLDEQERKTQNLLIVGRAFGYATIHVPRDDLEDLLATISQARRKLARAEAEAEGLNSKHQSTQDFGCSWYKWQTHAEQTGKRILAILQEGK